MKSLTNFKASKKTVYDIFLRAMRACPIDSRISSICGTINVWSIMTRVGINCGGVVRELCNMSIAIVGMTYYVAV